MLLLKELWQQFKSRALLWLSIVLVVILAINWILMQQNKQLRQTLTDQTNNILSELVGVKKETATNGSEIATVTTQMITYDMARQMDRAMQGWLTKRLDLMGVDFSRQVTDISVVNTQTEIFIRDSLIVVTDTSFSTKWSDSPWAEFESTVYPHLGFSDSRLKVTEKILFVEEFVKDTTKPWPIRWAYPRIDQSVFNNANPYVDVIDFKHYKIKNKRKDK